MNPERMYCPTCGAPVERGELNMAVQEGGKVKVSPPVLIPCQHIANPVTLPMQGTASEHLPDVVNEARRVVMKSRSGSVTVERATLQVLVEEVQGMLDSVASAKQAFPEPKSVEEPEPSTKG